MHTSWLVQVQNQMPQTPIEAEKPSARITATTNKLAQHSHVAHSIQVIAGRMSALSHAQVVALQLKDKSANKEASIKVHAKTTACAALGPAIDAGR